VIGTNLHKPILLLYLSYHISLQLIGRYTFHLVFHVMGDVYKNITNTDRASSNGFTELAIAELFG
jgi:hypothetical protein